MLSRMYPSTNTAFSVTSFCPPSGTPEALTLCIVQMCNIMLENPPRGPLIPYKPHALPNQAYQPRVNVRVSVLLSSIDFVSNCPLSSSLDLCFSYPPYSSPLSLSLCFTLSLSLSLSLSLTLTHSLSHLPFSLPLTLFPFSFSHSSLLSPFPTAQPSLSGSLHC